MEAIHQTARRFGVSRSALRLHIKPPLLLRGQIARHFLLNNEDVLEFASRNIGENPRHVMLAIAAIFGVSLAAAANWYADSM